MWFSVCCVQFNSGYSVSYGERVSIELTSLDQLGNFRESVWSVNIPLEPQVSSASLAEHCLVGA